MKNFNNKSGGGFSKDGSGKGNYTPGRKKSYGDSRDKDSRPRGGGSGYPRKKFGDSESGGYSSGGDRPPFQRGGYRKFQDGGGERPRNSYGSGGGERPRSNYGSGGETGGERIRPIGDRKPYGDRGGYQGKREDRPEGGRGSFGGDRGRGSFGGDRNRGSFGGDRNRGSFGGDRGRDSFGDGQKREFKRDEGFDRSRDSYGQGFEKKKVIKTDWIPILREDFTIPEGEMIEILYGMNAVSAVFHGSSDRKCYGVYSTESKRAEIEKLCEGTCLNRTMSAVELDEIASSNDHNGVALICSPFVEKSFDDLKEDFATTPRFLCVENIQDPGNLGALIRNAAFFGIKGIIVTKDETCPITPAVMKTSAGALELVDVYRVANIKTACAFLKSHEYWVVGTDKSGEDIKTFSVPEKYILVVGNEHDGMKVHTLKHCDFVIHIPGGNEQLDSLNVSSACAAVLAKFHL